MTQKKKMDTREKIILSALDLAAELGWEYVTLALIAERSGVDMVTFYDLFEDKADILSGFGRKIDKKVLDGFSLGDCEHPQGVASSKKCEQPQGVASLEKEKCEQRQGVASPQNGSPRDSLFDLLMDRFEVLNEHRDGVVAILESFKCDPKQMVIGAPHLCRSMSWMLEACGVNTSGIKGAMKVAGLTGLYLKTLKVWMGDESADLAKVMAALDKDLGRVESWAGSLGL